MRRKLVVLCAVLGALFSATGPAKAATTTVYTAPFSEASSGRSCSTGLPVDECSAQANVLKDGTLNLDASYSSPLGTSLGEADAYGTVALDVPLSSEAFALVVTETIHVDVSKESTPRSAPFTCCPRAYVDMHSEAEHTSCECAYGYTYPSVDLFSLSDTDVVLSFRVENGDYQNAGALIPPGTVRISLEASVTAGPGIAAPGDSTVTFHSTLQSVKVDVVAP